MNQKNRKLVPSGISLIRVVLSPIFFLTLINNLKLLSIVILLLAVVTDVSDGYIARKFGLKSVSGAYIDVTSDFIFICTGFSAYIIMGIYPFWLLILIIFMFLQFIITSRRQIYIYDPLGKHYGSLLFIGIFIPLITTEHIVYSVLIVIILVFSIISLISRLIFIYKH